MMDKKMRGGKVGWWYSGHINGDRKVQGIMMMKSGFEA